MGKSKKNSAARKKLSSNNELKQNPFEVRVNKVKHAVLGRKVCKYEVGKPFESRNKAFKTRKNTLFKEYKRKDKKGKGLVDRRLNDSLISGVELRKASVWKMKNSINESETILTHKGVDLRNHLTDTYSDLDEDDDEEDLLRRSDYVETAHFGGGDIGKPKSSKEFMDEMFNDKRQKQMEKEANIELTEKLDSEWLSVKNLLRLKGAKDTSVSGNDDYDLLVRQLTFGDNQQKAKLKVLDSESVESKSKREGKNRTFLSKIHDLLSTKDVSAVSSLLKLLIELGNQGVSDETFDIVKSILCDVRLISLQSVSLLILCSRLNALNEFFYLKSVQLLRNIKYSSMKHILRGVLLCQVIMNDSRDKLFPEVIQYLQNVLVLFFGQDYDSFFNPISELYKIKNRDIFLMDNSVTQHKEIFELSFENVFSLVELDESNYFKVSFVKATLKLVSEVALKCKHLPAFKEIFCDMYLIVEQISKLHIGLFPMENFVELFTEKRDICYLSREKPKPLMLPFFEPRLDSKKQRDTKTKLVKKYKREFKGAQRELKKDSAFLKNMWLEETLKKDRERKQKVNRLFAELSTESSLYKKRK